MPGYSSNLSVHHGTTPVSDMLLSQMMTMMMVMTMIVGLRWGDRWGLSYGWTRSSEGLRDTNRYKYDTNTIQIQYKHNTKL